MFLLSHSQAANAEATTQLTTLGGLGFQYYLKDNVSVGASVLASFDQSSADAWSVGYGGAAFASLHLRLGLGAFVRPTAAVGMLFGSQRTELAPGQLMSASEVAGLLRLGLPIAYFPGTRVVLQAGPELTFRVGQATPPAGSPRSFSNLAGSFGISAGYVF